MESSPTGAARSWWADLIAAILVGVIVALFVRTWVVQVFEIPTESMEPTLLRGDHVLVNRFVFGTGAADAPSWLPMRAVRRGDIVVFRFPPDPTRNYVKRAVALGGDVLEITDKELRVNQEPMDESAYVVHDDPRIYPRSLFLHDGYRKRDNFGPVVVPQGYLFMLGDNRDDSYDSRFWGQVPRRLLKGRPLVVLWSMTPGSPPGAAGAGKGEAPVVPTGVDRAPSAGSGEAASVLDRIRWRRTLRPVR
ncbi:MAG: signal peptidase I [Acidobacteria bacterium]|nr:signal peptidase I [Acidobacteriota bacterium]